jgi:hypothetical protein
MSELEGTELFQKLSKHCDTAYGISAFAFWQEAPWLVNVVGYRREKTFLGKLLERNFGLEKKDYRDGQWKQAKHFVGFCEKKDLDSFTSLLDLMQIEYTDHKPVLEEKDVDSL